MSKRRTPDEQIAELEKKKSQIDARIQKKRAQSRQEKRRQDTRRKIITGAIALEHMLIDASFRTTLGKLIDEHVKRPEDRKLFDL